MLEAIYAAYAEGWADATGADARGRNLAEEAIWLGRLLASLLPREPEALGLLALMLHAHARRDARRDADGGYVPLAQQDTRRWDSHLIDEAETLLHSAAHWAARPIPAGGRHPVGAQRAPQRRRARLGCHRAAL